MKCQLFKLLPAHPLHTQPFFWIVCLVFATIFFTKEYNTGTIKLSVAYGTKRTILYYTKAITILAVSLITYLIFVAAFFVIEIIQSGYIPSASEALTLFGWALACGIVLLAFESISIFLCVIIQNIGVVTGICCLYVFSGASVYLMLWSNMDAASIPLKIFCVWKSYVLLDEFLFLPHNGDYRTFTILFHGGHFAFDCRRHCYE